MNTMSSRRTPARRGASGALSLLVTLALCGCSSDSGSSRADSASNGTGGPTASGGGSGGTDQAAAAVDTSGNTVSTSIGGSSTTTVSSSAGGAASTASSMGGASGTTMAAGGSTSNDVGTTGMAGNGGSGGNQSGLNGGASGAFICPAGMTYGDPLEGMGSVQEIGPLQGDFFAFLEGPVWVGSLGTLFFSDHSSPRRIFKLVPPSTMVELFSPDSGSNGLALDNDDQLIVAEELNDRITRIDPESADPTMVDAANVLVDGYLANDLIYRSDGNVYFTNPSAGFYRADPAGSVTGPLTDVQGPNGTVLSPDENTLYVGSVNSREIWAFPLDAAGVVATASGALLATTTNGTLDGMAVDCAGNVYGGTDNGVEVFSPSGEALGVVPTGYSSNVTFGGDDRKTLYVTSQGLLKSVTVAVPGLPD